MESTYVPNNWSSCQITLHGKTMPPAGKASKFQNGNILLNTDHVVKKNNWYMHWVKTWASGRLKSMFKFPKELWSGRSVYQLYLGLRTSDHRLSAVRSGTPLELERSALARSDHWNNILLYVVLWISDYYTTHQPTFPLKKFQLLTSTLIFINIYCISTLQ